MNQIAATTHQDSAEKISFIDLSYDALHNNNLQSALQHIGNGFVSNRARAIAAVEDFEALRDAAKEVRERALKDLDVYLLHFEQKVKEAGGQVHWAETPEQLAQIVIEIAKAHNATTILKGKSMVAEEAHLNDVLEANGLIPYETDLGEYIIQLAKEPPSHIVVPALHKTKEEIKDLFLDAHNIGQRQLDTVPSIVNEAREIMRERFLNTDVSITGANMLVAETGAIVLVTNEGNGDLSATLPKLHIVTSSIEKIVPTTQDAAKILRVLARSATGQAITAYTSFYYGAKQQHGAGQAPDADGPAAYHIVLLNNQRTDILAGEYREMLNCIRCGACMNHCPVYTSVGGHAYDSVYPGPMGSVLTPLMHNHNAKDYASTFDLPNASSFCGRCAEVCPVRIPLPDLLRQLRVKASEEKLNSPIARWIVTGYMTFIRFPFIYKLCTQLSIGFMKICAGRAGVLRRLPGASGWMRYRNMPAPEGETFQQRWRRNKK